MDLQDLRILYKSIRWYNKVLSIRLISAIYQLCNVTSFRYLCYGTVTCKILHWTSSMLLNQIHHKVGQSCANRDLHHKVPKLQGWHLFSGFTKCESKVHPNLTKISWHYFLIWDTKIFWTSAKPQRVLIKIIPQLWTSEVLENKQQKT